MNDKGAEDVDEAESVDASDNEFAGAEGSDEIGVEDAEGSGELSVEDAEGVKDAEELTAGWIRESGSSLAKTCLASCR